MNHITFAHQLLKAYNNQAGVVKAFVPWLLLVRPINCPVELLGLLSDALVGAKQTIDRDCTNWR